MTNAELAVLSLVAEQPRHGYEIEQVIEQRGMREWTEIGFSSIYYLLKKLERQGLIRGASERTGGGPARRVYRLTPAGRKTMRRAVLAGLSEPTRGYPTIQLALANLPAVSKPEATAALQQYRRALAERRDHVLARQEAQRPLPYFVEAMFSQSLTSLEAELEWVEGFIRRLEAIDEQDRSEKAVQAFVSAPERQVHRRGRPHDELPDDRRPR